MIGHNTCVAGGPFEGIEIGLVRENSNCKMEFPMKEGENEYNTCIDYYLLIIPNLNPRPPTTYPITHITRNT